MEYCALIQLDRENKKSTRWLSYGDKRIVTDDYNYLASELKFTMAIDGIPFGFICEDNGIFEVWNSYLEIFYWGEDGKINRRTRDDAMKLNMELWYGKYGYGR